MQQIKLQSNLPQVGQNAAPFCSVHDQAHTPDYGEGQRKKQQPEDKPHIGCIIFLIAKTEDVQIDKGNRRNSRTFHMIPAFHTPQAFHTVHIFRIPHSFRLVQALFLPYVFLSAANAAVLLTCF